MMKKLLLVLVFAGLVGLAVKQELPAIRRELKIVRM
jgi:hypothetical protein